MNPSRLSSSHRRLVVDASVLINLLGTRRPAAILRALNRIFLIDEITLGEVTVNPGSGAPVEHDVSQLCADGHLTVVNMDTETYGFFIGFTGAAAPDDLDDGEAATLAHAVRMGYAAVIDERKATRIAAKQTPVIEVITTIDLLTAPQVVADLGPDGLSDALYYALRDARMRVPRQYREWIVSIVGDRAKDCPSIGSATKQQQDLTNM